MRFNQTIVSFFLLVTSFLLVACSKASSDQAAAIAAPISQDSSAAKPAPTEPAFENDDQGEPASKFWVEQVPRVDEQGAVVVEITPLNLNNPGNTLDFQVSLNTHSVDLSMNLATLATLATDTGYSVQATQWDAPLGGHHVSGKLFFPAMVDGVPLLAGAEELTLTLVDMDAPERIFVWEK